MSTGFKVGQWVLFFMLKQFFVPATPLDIGFLGVFPPLYHPFIVPEIWKGTIFLMGITSLCTAKANIYGHPGSTSLRNPNSASSPKGSNVSTHRHTGWGGPSWRRTPMPTAEKNEIINVASPNIHRKLVISSLAKATHMIDTTTAHICTVFAGVTRIVSPALRVSSTSFLIILMAKMLLAVPCCSASHLDGISISLNYTSEYHIRATHGTALAVKATTVMIANNPNHTAVITKYSLACSIGTLL